MKLSRRSFLTSMGMAAAGSVGMAGWAQIMEDPQAQLREWSNFEEQFRVSICRQCTGGCGILVRVVDGKVIKIAGNPLHPVNRGGLCPKGLAGTQVLYDPDRIRTPMERDGPRGEGQWKPITWEEALQKVTTRLKTLRDNGKPHALTVLGGQYRGLVGPLWQRFCGAYGTPNYLRYRCLEPEKAAPGLYYLHGLKAPLSHDLENARYILSFGCNLLESWQSTVYQLQAFGRLREREGGRRAQVVQVDPRFSVTAAKADRWVPVKPGTDGALALGLAYIIIQEGLYDRAFVQGKTFGFLDWKDKDGVAHTGFKTFVLNEFPPEKVAGITGVPTETLFALARGFATSHPAMAIGERGPSFHPNDLYTRMAIHSLNALVGSIGVEGGIVRQGSLPLADWEEVEGDETAAKGLSMPRADQSTLGSTYPPGDTIEALPGNLTAGKPYPVDTLLLYYANPVFSTPNGQAWRDALAQVPYVVSFSPFMDETSSLADLILPDSTYLERWQDDQITHLAGITMFSIGQPVVPPLYQTRQTEDVILQLAKGIGEPTASALAWESFEDLLYETAQGLHESGRGHIIMPPRDEDFEAILARQGYREEPYEDFDDFWDALLEKGAWWDPNDTYVGMKQLFATPSGRFEFYSQTLRNEMLQAAQGAGGLDKLARGLGLAAREDMLFLPHFEAPPAEDIKVLEQENGTFILNTYKLMSSAGGRGASQPRLQEHPAVHLDGGWSSWVEINPETAATLGIEEMDWVVLTSKQGAIKSQARLFAGTRPDVLNMPYGQGHTAFGRWARNRGQNPNNILAPTADPMRGLPVWSGTRVRLTKA